MREDTARVARASLAEAFATAGKSLKFYNRLVASQERTQGKELLGEITRWTETPVTKGHWSRGYPDPR